VTKRVLTYCWLIMAAIVLLFPILLTLLGSFVPDSQLLTQPPRIFSGHYSLDNYRTAFAQQVVPLLPAFEHSLMVGGVIMAAHLITSCLAAYALVFLQSSIRKPLFWLFMATIMIPYESIVVPNALFVRAIGIGDSPIALVIPFLANGFGVFLLRQAFLAFPRELQQAAHLDGAGHFRFLFSILLPTVKPSLIALATWSFLQGWNMYFWPMIISLRSNINTLQTAVFSLRSNESNTPGLLLAGITITLIPTLLLVIFGQRWLVRGFTSGAVK
jgi:sn-glycerol 3-phosphate transport system permease protein